MTTERWEQLAALQKDAENKGRAIIVTGTVVLHCDAA